MKCNALLNYLVTLKKYINLIIWTLLSTYNACERSR